MKDDSIIHILNLMAKRFAVKTQILATLIREAFNNFLARVNKL